MKLEELLSVLSEAVELSLKAAGRGYVSKGDYKFQYTTRENGLYAEVKVTNKCGLEIMKVRNSRFMLGTIMIELYVNLHRGYETLKDKIKETIQNVGLEVEYILRRNSAFIVGYKALP